MSQTDIVDLEPIRHPSGLIAKISVRQRAGGQKSLSFMIAKEFDREGRTEHTAWLARRHFDAIRELLDKVEERLDAEEDRIRVEEREARRESRKR